MKSTIYLIVFLMSALTGARGQTVADPSKVWLGVIELPDDTLSRHILNDLPGTICVLKPEDGKIIPQLIGNKVLKKEAKLPDLKANPTLLVSSTIKKDRAGDIGYLSFISASMEKEDEAKFSIVESSHSAVMDNDIDWVEFESRVEKYRKKFPELPADTRFGVIRVASVITISYQTFRSVKNAGKISGWGFSAKGRYLSQKTEESHIYKVGVSLTYSDAALAKEFNLPVETLAGHTPSSSQLTGVLSDAMTLKARIEEPAQFVEDEDLSHDQ